MTGASASSPTVANTLVIEPGHVERNYWKDIWRYRELFIVLAWRDVVVRYKQTVIGLLWAIIRPFFAMVVFTIIFGKLAKLPSDGNAPYTLLVFAGMLPWFLFSSVLNDASNSVITNGNLIGKVYFPRIIIPASASVVGLADFVVSMMIYLCVALWYGALPDWRIIFLPIFIVLAVLTSLGPALLLSALNVKYRDFRYIVPVLVQFGLYISPVGFSSFTVPEKWRLLFSLNPAVGLIDGFRWCLLRGDSQLYLPGLFVSVMSAAFFFWIGLRYFRQTERKFADLI
jgi:lipopolysaccharide transport system permease protein